MSHLCIISLHNDWHRFPYHHQDMRTSAIIVTLLALLCASPTRLYSAPDFTSMPIEEVRKNISAVAVTDYASGLEVVEAALKSRRTEVILACYDSRVVNSLLAERVQNMEDSYLKGQLLVMKLRHGKNWPDGNPVRMYNEQGRTALYVLPMVSQYLPDTPVEYKVISSPELRKSLADKLEVAVRKKWGISEEDPNSESKQGGLITVTGEGNAAEVKPSTAIASVQHTPEAGAANQPVEQPKHSDQGISSWLGVLIVAAFGLLWLLVKKRK